MTSSQDKKYWRCWAAVCRANFWFMRCGRLDMLPELIRANEEFSPHHARVWTYARQLASQKHMAVVTDHLRHACHILAAGKAVSHKQLTNPQFNKLLCLWGDEKRMRGLLVDPLCLESSMNWDDTNRQNLDYLQQRIERLYHEAYVIKVSERVFHKSDWRSLTAKQLHWLDNELEKRRNATRADRKTK